ncbi:MAG TPA: phosphatidate cytidylyltransferase [bacterium]|nr:phosphatidate cytidylyltransferase [bacterium]
MNSGLARIVVAIVALPFVIAAIIYGSWYFFALMGTILLIGISEMLNLLRHKNSKPQTFSAFFWGLIFLGLTFFGKIEFLLSALFLFAIYTMTVELFRNTGSDMMNMAATWMTVFYPSLLIGSMILLRNTGASESHSGAQVVVLVLLSIWACDTFAYYGGRMMGKNKFFERVSPKKTWEGAITGFFGALIGVWLVRYIYLTLDIPFIMSLPQTLVIGFFGGTFGQIGDLAESLLKRDAGIKDSGALLPGHGGILDRFDSMMFVAPLTYIYVTYFVL